jgi:hypothetical protein
MAQQLKRWESPRRKGRNDKGRGGAARQRQLAKRNQTLRKRLKEAPTTSDSDSKRGEPMLSSFFASVFGEYL